MTTLHARKLTLITRLFYAYPKRFLWWLYSGPLREHKHTRYVLFESLIVDLAYMIKHHKEDQCPLENQLALKEAAKTSDWWTKDKTINLYGDILIEFMSDLENFIKCLGPKTVIDIGCANGLRIDQLAMRFPKTNFIGLDFTITAASQGNRFPNASFIQGYPLELLESIATDGTKIDMVYATQSLFFALPEELHRYFKVFDKLEVKSIAIFDTNTNGLRSRNDGKLWSRHMAYRTAWCHNYSGYFKQYGYQVTGFKQKLYDKHPSRSDYWLSQIFGER